MPLRHITIATAAAAVLLAAAADARTLRFSGRAWDVKTSQGEPAGPGPNIFTDAADAVYLDAKGDLHLTISQRDGQWQSTEIVARRSLGYGTYRFDVAPGATLIADNAVLGLFTYDLRPPQNYRELDIELSRWGEGRVKNLQCSVQPADAPDLYSQFALAENAKGWIMEFTWAPGVFTCQVSDKRDGRVLGSGRVTRGVPTPGREQTRLNLWQFRGAPPTNGVASEVIVRRFTFTPLAPAARH